jgi:hypothetical protein
VRIWITVNREATVYALGDPNPHEDEDEDLAKRQQILNKLTPEQRRRLAEDGCLPGIPGA